MPKSVVAHQKPQGSSMKSAIYDDLLVPSCEKTLNSLFCYASDAKMVKFSKKALVRYYTRRLC